MAVAVDPAEVARLRAELLERYDVDPDEDARRRQLLAERRERIEQRDRAEAARDITWQPLSVDTFDADEPPPTFDGWAVLLRAVAERQPAWMANAACIDADPALFFPDRGESTNEAKALCATCPTVAPCEDYADAEGIRFGIWSGRSMATRSRRRAA